MKIGIVGAGIAGLTAAWLFRKAGNRVSVLEHHSSPGMDAHSINHSVGGPKFRADIPPRMFQPLLWPELTRLYQELGVETELVDPSKTFSTLDQSPTLKLGQRYQIAEAKNLFNSSARTIHRDVTRMLDSAHRDLQSLSDDITMKQYLAEQEYSSEFIFQFLYPALSSTVCTCSYDSLDEFPASTLIPAMLRLTETGELFRTRHGTRDVVERLTSGIEMQLNTPVTQVIQTDAEARIQVESGDWQDFDHVVIATQANSAIRIASNLELEERQTLESFKYENVEVVLHADSSLMPGKRSNWSTFNLISNRGHSAAMCSIPLDRFYPERPKTGLIQTIMPVIRPQPDKTIATAKMQRPVVTQQSVDAISTLQRLHDKPGRRIWFSGSYANAGVPLLESGVRSSVLVAQKLGVDWPTPCTATT